MIKIKNIFTEQDLDIFNFEEKKLLDNILLENVTVSKENKDLKLSILAESELTESILSKLKQLIFKHLPTTGKIELGFTKLNSQNKFQILITKIWDKLLERVFLKAPAAQMWLLDSYWELDEKRINIYVEPGGAEFLKERKVSSLIEHYLANSGIPLKVSFKEIPSNGRKKDTYDINEEEKEIIESILRQNSERSGYEKSSVDLVSNGAAGQYSSILLGKKIEERPIPIGENITENSNMTFMGEIFNIEKRELRNRTLLLTFGLTDYTGSIPVKIFLSEKQKSLEQAIKEGMWVKVRGKIEISKYTQEHELVPLDINIDDKPERVDTSPEKRVELHLHTRYSSMDALCSPESVLKTVKKWGHKAVAFTDHGVLQSFPEVYSVSKKLGIKPIYGVEAYIFDDENPVMTQPPDKMIKDTVFVVTDIETTGLCFDGDEIIEIGAVKVINNEIIDRFSSFVKPKHPVPPNIVNLTGITNEMLESAEPIEKVLPQFIDFLGNAVFVAHNADFDSGFIRRDAERLGLSFKNGVLDTLALARIILSKLKNHRLDTIAKDLNIGMGSHHRAVDDANTAALILKELLGRVSEAGINNLSKINDIYKLQKGTVTLSSYHAIIQVKSNEGLKNLYRLVSMSHLNFFYRHPRIPKSLLKRYRDGLIIGSGCQAGELYQSLLHFDDPAKIERIAEFYDFLEIQPLQNNMFLIDGEYVSGIERLENINRAICDLGKKLNKPVVMTGDVHFLNPQDEIFRKILLNAQGFQDADKESKLYLRTTDEMLNECQYLGEKTAYEVVVENPNIIANEIADDIVPFPEGLYPPKIDGAEEEIIEMTYRQAKQIYGEELPQIVEDRLKHELDSIVNNGYAVIYLIAHKLVKKSMEDGYLVGSRGSVGSSLVATMCQITEVNPLPPHYICPKCKLSIFEEDKNDITGPDLPDINCPKCGTPMRKEGFNIPFEVFMGFEGDKIPDIDLNFSGEYQSKAHKYVEELFGEHHVFRAGTISTVAQKTAFGFVRAYLEEKNVQLPNIELTRLSEGITGVKRTTGQHPGGIIVVPKDKEIFEFTPIQHPADDKGSGVITTHFEYHSISDRLLKLDLLGHDDPTVIKMLEEETGINVRKIPLDDPATLKIFSSLESLGLDPKVLGTTVGTLGVPEFGTKFVRQMLEDTRPTTFSELVRISGLSHGTDVWLNNAQNIIKSRIATLKDVIATRDDIMIYLINNGVNAKIAFSIMEDVRKGRGLKPEYEKILSENKNVNSWFIDSCKKIRYLFPKAHAVAYVIMAFRIAYFKVHYPEAFYATYFTVKADDFDAELILQGPKKIREKMAEIERNEKEATAKEKNLFTILEVANEMYARGIQFAQIDLYKSDVKRFKITEAGILPPLKSLQGLGITAAQNIERERRKGRFTSIDDLQRRARITKNVVQILRQNGVLANLQETDQISLF
ncbi:DNA polymerase III PolC-type [Tepidanaerobacter syntrophicus]|uniref:PolC-type DNA polymerase III n=1 Tax=Tepidanaerobacter syntrophicus TaxID=224999 RepID=UPI0022EF5878|nr:PolC-type DNA polymerase III [Tepidanaerobacter syntrophicus]GLI19204.1 DNA polymerase III PolC-type [Tepidanaerobacter syntrophicus]